MTSISTSVREALKVPVFFGSFLAVGLCVLALSLAGTVWFSKVALHYAEPTRIAGK